MIKMKRRIVGILLCMLMITTLPLAAGMNFSTETKHSKTAAGLVGKTFIRGIITKPRIINGGRDITFRAIYVHYISFDARETQRGVLRGFQKITLKNDFVGHCGDPLGRWVYLHCSMET